MKFYPKRFIQTLFLLILIFSLLFMGCQEPEPIPEIEAPPVLLSPDDNARLGSTQNLNFSWETTTNANTYFLNYRIDAEPEKSVEFTGDTTNLLVDASEFSDYGFEIGTIITWTVTAQSTVNQMESESRSFEIMDDIPPTVADLTITNPFYTINDIPVYAKTQTVSFSATIEDNIGVTDVQVTVVKGTSTISLVIPEPTMSNGGSGTTYSGSFQVGDTFDDNSAIYNILVVALDAEENVSEQQSISFGLDEMDPGISFSNVITTPTIPGNSSDFSEPIIVIPGTTVGFNVTVTDEVDNDPNNNKGLENNQTLTVSNTADPEIESEPATERTEPATERTEPATQSLTKKVKDVEEQELYLPKRSRIIDTVVCGIYDGSQPVSITVNWNDNGNGNYTGDFIIPSSGTLDVGKPYTVSVTATDTNGNNITVGGVFKLDPIPPEITDFAVTSPDTEIDGVPIFANADNVEFSCNIIENIPAASGGSIVSFRAGIYEANGNPVEETNDGSGTIALTFSYNTGNEYVGGFTVENTEFVNGGTYTIRVTAEDNSGNEGSSSIIFKVDSEAPLNSGLQVTEYVNGENTITDLSELKFIGDEFILNGLASDNVKIDRVYVIIERDGNGTPDTPAAIDNDLIGDGPNGTWYNDGGSDDYLKFLCAGQENWSAGIDIDDGTYYIWLRAFDGVGNETTSNDPVPFNTVSVPANEVVVDTAAPTFTIYKGETINKYNDYNTIANPWTIAELIEPSVSRSYPPYNGTISETSYYDSGDDGVTYHAPNYAADTGILPIVDLDIYENGGAGKKVIVEIAIDGVFEGPIVVYTGPDVTIDTDTYNADIGLKNDATLGGGSSTAGARISRKDATGTLLTGDEGTYRINLLDFPKGTGNMIADGAHQITFKLTDEAGNSTDKTVYVTTKLLHRPYLVDPDLGTNANVGDTFFFYHPNTTSVVNDLVSSRDRIALADYVSAYYIDISSIPPDDADPSQFEDVMISRRMEIGTAFEFTIDDWDHATAPDPPNFYYELHSDYLNIAEDENLGAGQWYWRIRAVMEDSNGNLLYNIGSDNLPFALEEIYNNPNNNLHTLTDTNIHDIRVGNVYPPNITSPAYGEYFGTSETITINWDAPTEGDSTGTSIDGYIMQMRAVSTQGDNGEWLNMVGSQSLDGTTWTYNPVNVLTHSVDFSAAPINSNFGLYQFRVRTIDNDLATEDPPRVPASGWDYGLFVYTGDTVSLSTNPTGGHLASVDVGMPFKVNDMAITDSGRLVFASSEDNRIWFVGADGKVETSVSLGDVETKIIVPVTEAIEVINPDTLETTVVDVEVFYLYANDSSLGDQILKLNHEYELDPNFVFNDFSDAGVDANSMDNIVGIDYDGGSLYVYVYNEVASIEKIIQINTVLADYVELADLWLLTSYDGVTPAINTPTHFGVDANGNFIILDKDELTPITYKMTRLLSDGGFFDELDLTDGFTQGFTGGNPIASSISDVTDLDIYQNEVAVTLSFIPTDSTEEIGKAFRFNTSGSLVNPSNGVGYEEGDADYDVKKASSASGNMFVFTKSNVTDDDTEKFFKIGKNTGETDVVWGYDGTLTGGGTWSTAVVALPGQVSILDDSTLDGYPLNSADSDYKFVIDKATQNIVRIDASNPIRSQAFTKLSGMAVSPLAGTTRGIYVSDSEENAIYHLGTNLTPIAGGSFDDDGKMDPAVFDVVNNIDTSDPPDGIPDETEIIITPLNQPMGMHFEVRENNNGDKLEYLYIADYGNERIVSLQLTQAGKNAFKVFRDLNMPTGIKPIDVAVFDREGIMYVLTENNEVRLYSRQGGGFYHRFTWSVPGNEATAIDADQLGCVYVTTEHGVYKWGFDYWPYWGGEEKPLSSISTEGLLFGSDTAGDDDDHFNMPSGLTVGLTDWDDLNRNYGGMMLYVSDMVNRRIKVLLEGNLP